MRVAIFGGRLQGIEAAYLCSKAGYQSIVVDRDPSAPAKGLVDEFHALDIVRDSEEIKRILEHVEVALPAIENRNALILLERICREVNIPLMHDNQAFSISSDKTASIDFLGRSGIPVPESWPTCGFPVIVKPSSMSGSASVYRANSQGQLEEALGAVRKIDAKPVVQEFIVGLALSLEVLSRMGVGQPLQITGLEFDAQYGCKRVYAPVETPEPVEASMNEIGRKIASRLNLHGLTDVQALLKGSAPRVNEINARLPSQTPTVVYQSAGINMLELLVDLFLNDRLGHVEVQPKRAALYQHVQVSEGELRLQGEHIMANASGLRVEMGFMGADEAITNLGGQRDAKEGVATLIVTSSNLQAARERMAKVVERMMRQFELERYSDPAPEGGEFS